MSDELDKLKADHTRKAESLYYEGLEENILELRTTVSAQAILLKELGLVEQFCDRVIYLEELQKDYDDWCDREYEKNTEQSEEICSV